MGEERRGATTAFQALACSHARKPLGIDTTSPRFSWILTSTERGAMQSAYRILAASSADALAKDAGGTDSGWQSSPESPAVKHCAYPISLETCPRLARANLL
ncbi:MAG: glycoside hydrolase family 78 protein [Planctomycetota bacterium]